MAGGTRGRWGRITRLAPKPVITSENAAVPEGEPTYAAPLNDPAIEPMGATGPQDSDGLELQEQGPGQAGALPLQKVSADIQARLRGASGRRS